MSFLEVIERNSLVKLIQSGDDELDILISSMLSSIPAERPEMATVRDRLFDIFERWNRCIY
jgi:hypothetical protein